MNYTQKAISGVFWTACLRGSIRLVNLIKIAILARLLLPAQFGVYGVVAIALALLEIMTETGINVFLVQEKSRLEKYIDTAWIVSICRGLLISALLLLFSAPIADFFHTPDALFLLRLAALIPLVRGFINPACVTFLKELQFAREFLYRGVIILAEGLFSVSLALLTHSPASLVWGLLVSSVVEVVLSFVFITPRPRWEFSSSQARQILARGKWVTGFGILDYLFTTGDNIVVGRMLGSTALGLYQNSYKLSTVPLNEVAESYFKITFPLFTKMAAQGHPLQRAVFRGVGISVSIYLLIGTLVFLLARPLVLIFLGPAWLEAVPIVKVLAFLGIFRGINYSFNSLFMAHQHQNYVTAITLCNALGLLLTIVPLIRIYGINGAAAAALIGSVSGLPVALILIRKTMKLL